MSYLVLVLCHNEVHYIKLFQSVVEAKAIAIEMANQWYHQDGLDEYSSGKIKTIDEMQRYYQSEAYFNSGDFCHVLIEEIVESNLTTKLPTKIINLQINGEVYNRDSYTLSDNLDAIIVSESDVATIRVTTFNEVGINILSNSKIISKEFRHFLNSLKKSSFLREYLIESYEEYLNEEK